MTLNEDDLFDIVYEPKLDIDEFIRIHNPKSDTDKWIQYNEAIITPDYKIIAARPSHERCLLRLLSESQNIPFNELRNHIPIYVSPTHYIIERYHYISLWYDCAIIYPGALMDYKISKIFNKLLCADMFDSNILKNIMIAHDYSCERFNNGEITHDEYLNFMQRINKSF